jgi:predicted kinase
MPAGVIMVNGLPGSGKSTLAAGLATALSIPALGKDVVKEALGGIVGDAVPASKLGAIAMDVLWSVTAATDGLALLDSWWFRPRDLEFAVAGLGRCGHPPAVEVWCDVPATVARQRYTARRRHDVYEDARHLIHSWTEWAADPQPLGIGPVIRVDTMSRVDADQLAAAVTKQLAAERLKGDRVTVNEAYGQT